MLNWKFNYLYNFFSRGNFVVSDRTSDSLTVKSKDNKVVISAIPFKIEFYKAGVLVAVVNARGLFTVEHFRKKG